MEIKTERRIGDGFVAAVRGDITTLEVDAVVNAANEQLHHGGGVAAAIALAGGPSVQEESTEWVRTHGPLTGDQAAVTTAGSMPARHVIHVVGPRYTQGQDNKGMLGAATRSALRSAADHGDDSIAMPAISAGIFGYPPDEATRVITAAVVEWLGHRDTPSRVLLVGYDDAMAERFSAALSAET